ncbi:unnamed protein product [Calypogeia fissa]
MSRDLLLHFITLADAAFVPLLSSPNGVSETNYNSRESVALSGERQNPPDHEEEGGADFPARKDPTSVTCNRKLTETLGSSWCCGYSRLQHLCTSLGQCGVAAAPVALPDKGRIFQFGYGALQGRVAGQDCSSLSLLPRPTAIGLADGQGRTFRGLFQYGTRPYSCTEADRPVEGKTVHWRASIEGGLSHRPTCSRR